MADLDDIRRETGAHTTNVNEPCRNVDRQIYPPRTAYDKIPRITGWIGGAPSVLHLSYSVTAPDALSEADSKTSRMPCPAVSPWS